MASPYPQGDREKVASKLPPALRQTLKIRAAELSLDIQDAVTAAVSGWREHGQDMAPVETSGAESFSTWLPDGMYEDFKGTCGARKLSYIQGLAQSIYRWLELNPSPKDGAARTDTEPERKIICNQKGGVGKTSVAAGMAQAYAEQGLRVLLVDYDPQGHLSEQLDIPQIKPGQDSLVSHMCGEGKGELRDLVVVIEDPKFEKRLHVLPACYDGFLLDPRIAVIATQKRGFQKEASLELALRPLESEYDVIVLDCPPSLGIAMDAGLYYGRRRRNEEAGRSGVVIPVLAEDSSATAYGMLAQQITDLCDDLSLEVDYLGLVVNLYDSRRGYVATSSLAEWKKLGDPRVLAVIGDLKEQREAVRKRRPLLSYAPHSDQAEAMRQIARGASR